MFKENGRLDKANKESYKREKANKSVARKFKCSRCKAIDYIDNKSVEFGKKYTCPECGAYLIEDIKY